MSQAILCVSCSLSLSLSHLQYFAFNNKLRKFDERVLWCTNKETEQIQREGKRICAKEEQEGKFRHKRRKRRSMAREQSFSHTFSHRCSSKWLTVYCRQRRRRGRQWRIFVNKKSFYLSHKLPDPHGVLGTRDCPLPLLCYRLECNAFPVGLHCE